MAKLSDWDGALSKRTDPAECLLVMMPLKPSNEGGSGTFLARLSDSGRWWVKPESNPQGPKVVVTELIVGKVAGLIGAAACEVEVARIPKEIEGWEYRPGQKTCCSICDGVPRCSRRGFGLRSREAPEGGRQC